MIIFPGHNMHTLQKAIQNENELIGEHKRRHIKNDYSQPDLFWGVGLSHASLCQTAEQQRIGSLSPSSCIQFLKRDFSSEET